MDSLLSFPGGLFHPLQHAGLSRRSPSCRQSRNIPKLSAPGSKLEGTLVRGTGVHWLPCETITRSNGTSSSARSAGNARCSCDGDAQTRSSPPGAVSASAKTRARCSGSQRGVSLRPRPSYRATIPPGRWLSGSMNSSLLSGISFRKKRRGPNARGRVDAGVAGDRSCCRSAPVPFAYGVELNILSIFAALRV